MTHTEVCLNQFYSTYDVIIEILEHGGDVFENPCFLGGEIGSVRTRRGAKQNHSHLPSHALLTLTSLLVRRN